MWKVWAGVLSACFLHAFSQTANDEPRSFTSDRSWSKTRENCRQMLTYRNLPWNSVKPADIFTSSSKFYAAEHMWSSGRAPSCCVEKDTNVLRMRTATRNSAALKTLVTSLRCYRKAHEKIVNFLILVLFYLIKQWFIKEIPTLKDFLCEVKHLINSFYI